MSKFKVGDRIKRVADPILGLPIGYETEVYTVNGDQITYWNSAGLIGMSHESNWELVKPASPPSPVRTVTRKEIVFGDYGPVVINSSGVEKCVWVHIEDDLNASELSDVINTLTQVRDALADALEA